MTIIDGNDLDSVVTFVGSENADCKMMGFTITGGNAAGSGGGIQGNFTGAKISKCIIKDNVAQSVGGGVAKFDGILEECVISGNSAMNRGGGLIASSCSMINCLIYDNEVGYFDGSTQGYGGAMYNCDGTITNCTIAFNSASSRAGGLDGYNGTIANCIVWGNELEQLLNCSQPTYSCIQDWYGGGIGNINNNPLLGDPANEDYHLQPGSPCIDAGNNGAVPVEIDRDFDGNARFADDPCKPDTGSGTKPIVDMGAYEGSYILYADLYVDDDAVGANDGTSWANAFNYLQDALSAARYGAQIFVAEGTYMPDETTTNPNGSSDREAAFKLKNGVALYGGFPSGGGTWAERDPNLYETILDGDLDGDDDVFVEPGPGGGWPGENCADATTIYEGETPFDTTGSTTDGPGDCEANQDIWYVYTPEWTGYLKVDLCNSNFDPYVAIYEGLACPPTELVLCASDFCNSRVSILVSEGTSYLIRIGADGNYTGTGIITLSRDLRGGNSYHVVTAWDVGESCVFDGFTVTGGNANGDFSPHFNGGGMHNERCEARISNCTFRANHGVAGGGMCNDESFATVDNCLFIENVAEELGGGVDNRELSGPTFTNCAFMDNIAKWAGGGMRNGSSITVLSNCTFTGNSADFGGGIDDSTSTLDNCTFSNNSAGRKGGAVYAAFSNSTLTNCTFTGNSSGWRGGAVSCDYGSIPILTNCTFTANYAANYGGGICNQDNSHPTLTNCILWDNAAQTGSQIYDIDETSAPTVSYCDVQGGWPGEGNIDANPRFVDPNGADGVIGTEDDDLHLLGDSACIDAGTDVGVYEDIEGNVRPFDYPDVDNNGDLPEFDMGAYEAVAEAMVEVEMKFTPQALNPGSQGKWVKAHLVLPEGFDVDDVDADTPAEIEQLDIESEYMNVFINEDGLVEIEAAFRRSDFCAGVDYGPGEVTVIGRLTSGQYFCGSDTIRIITNKLGYVADLASYWLEADCGPPDWCGGLDVDQDSVVDWLDFAMSDGCCIKIIRE